MIALTPDEKTVLVTGTFVGGLRLYTLAHGKLTPAGTIHVRLPCTLLFLASPIPPTSPTGLFVLLPPSEWGEIGTEDGGHLDHVGMKICILGEEDKLPC